MILVTGHRGLIGSKLFEKIDAVGIDLKSGHNLLTCPLPKGVTLIYHLAAQTSVESSWEDPVHDSDNLRMLVRLVKEYPNTRIIYANSAAALEPVSSPYGFSKKACADYLKKFHQDYVICTFPNVYGYGSKSVVDIFKENKEVTVYGDGEQKRDYVHVDDIVQGLLKAQAWNTGEYQLGSGIPTTVNELLRPHHVVTYAPARKEAREACPPNTTLDWEPVISVHDYLNG